MNKIKLLSLTLILIFITKSAVANNNLLSHNYIKTGITVFDSVSGGGSNVETYDYQNIGGSLSINNFIIKVNNLLDLSNNTSTDDININSYGVGYHTQISSTTDLAFGVNYLIVKGYRSGSSTSIEHKNTSLFAEVKKLVSDKVALSAGVEVVRSCFIANGSECVQNFNNLANEEDLIYRLYTASNVKFNLGAMFEVGDSTVLATSYQPGTVSSGSIELRYNFDFSSKK